MRGRPSCGRRSATKASQLVREASHAAAPPRRPASVRGFCAGPGRAGPISLGRGLERRGASGAPRGTGRNPPFWARPPRRGAPASPPPGKPTCFYTARRVSAGISSDRLRTMEQKILGEIRSQLEMARPPGRLPSPPLATRPQPQPQPHPHPGPTQARPPGNTSCNTMKDLVAMLGEALELQARARARLRLTPARARLRLTPAALHAARRTRTARAPHAHRRRLSTSTPPTRSATRPGRTTRGGSSNSRR